MNSAQINRSCPAKVSPTLAPAKAKPAVRRRALQEVCATALGATDNKYCR